MPHTYTQLYIHIIFAVSGRVNFLRPEIKEEAYHYIAGTIRGLKQTLIAMNGMPDHLHILLGLKSGMAIAKLVHDIKLASNHFFNEKGWFGGRYTWQEGYGAFSYSRSQLDRVANYIRNQEKHHLQTNFRSEYLSLLKGFQVEYDEKYLFEWYE